MTNVIFRPKTMRMGISQRRRQRDVVTTSRHLQTRVTRITRKKRMCKSYTSHFIIFCDDEWKDGTVFCIMKTTISRFYTRSKHFPTPIMTSNKLLRSSLFYNVIHACSKVSMLKGLRSTVAAVHMCVYYPCQWNTRHTYTLSEVCLVFKLFQMNLG